MRGDREGKGGESDPAERLLDVALREVLGGERPPDLAERVRASLLAAAPAPGPAPALPFSHRRLRAVVLGFAAGTAAAAAVLLATGIMPWRVSGGAAAPPSRIEAAVADGAVEHWGSGGRPPVVARASAGDRFLLQRRAHVRTGPTAAALRIEDFGRLRLAPTTEIEVVDMNWKDFGSGAMLGSVTVAVVAGVIAWTSSGNELSAANEARAGEQVRLAGGPAALAARDAASVTAMEQELARARTRIAELETQVARRPAPSTSEPEPSPATEVAESEGAEPANGERAAFTYPGLDEALASIDWKTMGSATSKMAPLLAKLVEAVENGDELPLDLAGEIQQLNGLLVKQAGVMVKGGIPGETVNGAFTHPLVVANQWHALFDGAGQPMSEAQRQDLQSLAVRYAAEEQQRRAEYGPDVPKVQRMLEELELRDRFMQDARSRLTREQLAAIDAGGVRGTTMDLFSTGIAWSPVAKPMIGSTREEVVDGVGQRVVHELKLSGAAGEQVRAIVSRLMGQFPEELWRVPPSKAVHAGKFEVERVKAAARLQVQMVREIARATELTAEQRQKLLQQPMVLVPYVRGK